MKIKKILIYTSESFPVGMAGTNRIISYAKGFSFHGKDVEVICLRRTEKKNNIKNNNRTGYYENIKFKYLAMGTVRSDFFILRRMQTFFGYFSLLFSCLKNIKKSTVTIYYSSDTMPLLLIWLVNKLMKGLLLKEESEHPNVYLSRVNFISKYLLKNVHYNLFDGYILMTKNLVSYFNSKTKIPHIHIPMTVELDRFDLKLKKEEENMNHIVYTGFLGDEKDGIDILLKAFAGVVEKYNSFHLDLYGSAKSEENLQKYHQMVEELKISDFVHFKGRVTREVITDKLLKAKILVLPRPDSLQAQNGFPTKLGEYLATGNPTLVTSVGEIPDYLTDNQDCFISVPGDVHSFRNKLLEIIENYPKALEIGMRGRKIAETHFSNINQTKKIITFIENSYN